MATAEAPPASTASSEPAVRPRPRRPPDGVVAAGFTLPALIVYALFVLWPLVGVVRLSLYDWSGYGPQTFTGFGNFAALFSDPIFRTSLGHSLLWGAGAIVLGTLAALGVALVAHRSRVRSLVLAVLFFPALLPATVVAAIWVLVYSPRSGLLTGVPPLHQDWLGDPHLALGALFAAWAWAAIGIGTLIFWTGLQAIGREWYELAMVEGAGPFWRFFHVTLPGLRRTGLIVVLVNAALAAQVFDLVFVTTGGGPGNATLVLPIDVYDRAFGGKTGQGAAGAGLQLALGLALALLALLLLRRPVESLDEGPAASPRPRTLPTAIVVAVLLIFLAPLAWLLRAAVEPGRTLALGAAGATLDPRAWAWSNLPTVWNGGMSGATVMSLLLGIAVVAGVLLLAAPAAFALAHLIQGTTWHVVALVLLLLGLLQPTPVLIIPLFFLLKDLGLLDSVWGVLLPEIARALPFAVLLLWAFLLQSPREALEAAQIDGAGPWQRMRHVALPLARPALYAAGIWAFITSWNEYLLPTIVSTDGSLQTVPTVLAAFVGKYDTQFGLLAAGSIMAILPALLIYVVLRRAAGAGIRRAERTLE